MQKNKKQCLSSAVDAFPEEITFDNCLEAFKMRDELWNQYDQLSPELQNDPDVQAAYQKNKRYK